MFINEPNSAVDSYEHVFKLIIWELGSSSGKMEICILAVQGHSVVKLFKWRQKSKPSSVQYFSKYCSLKLGKEWQFYGVIMLFEWHSFFYFFNENAACRGTE